MPRWEFDIPENAREEWRVIPPYPLYQISDYGRVRRTKNRRLLTQRLSVQGFPQVTLSVNNRVQARYVHSLVAEAFHGIAPIDHYVQHIDGDKANNTPENLRYVQGYSFSGRSPNLGQQASSVVPRTVHPGWYIYRNSQLLSYLLPSHGARAAVVKEFSEILAGAGLKNSSQDLSPAALYNSDAPTAVYYVIYVAESAEDDLE